MQKAVYLANHFLGFLYYNIRQDWIPLGSAQTWYNIHYIQLFSVKMCTENQNKIQLYIWFLTFLPRASPCTHSTHCPFIRRVILQIQMHDDTWNQSWDLAKSQMKVYLTWIHLFLLWRTLSIQYMSSCNIHSLTRAWAIWDLHFVQYQNYFKP